MPVRHPISKYPNYLDIVKKYLENGSIRSNCLGDLIQFTYNDIEVWKNGWDEIIEISRGIIFDSPIIKNMCISLHDYTTSKKFYNREL